jgi:hypothetical protein
MRKAASTQVAALLMGTTVFPFFLLAFHLIRPSCNASNHWSGSMTSNFSPDVLWWKSIACKDQEFKTKFLSSLCVTSNALTWLSFLSTLITCIFVSLQSPLWQLCCKFKELRCSCRIQKESTWLCNRKNDCSITYLRIDKKRMCCDLKLSHLIPLVYVGFLFEYTHVEHIPRRTRSLLNRPDRIDAANSWVAWILSRREIELLNRSWRAMVQTCNPQWFHTHKVNQLAKKNSSFSIFLSYSNLAPRLGDCHDWSNNSWDTPGLVRYWLVIPFLFWAKDKIDWVFK